MTHDEQFYTDDFGHLWRTKHFNISGTCLQATEIKGKWYRSYSYGFGSFRTAVKHFINKPQFNKIFQIHESGLCTVLVQVTNIY